MTDSSGTADDPPERPASSGPPRKGFFEESVEEWIERMPFETTEDIEIPERLIDQVIGQDEAVDIIKKAAQQKRHVLLIGDPGTGKSMLAQSMTEFLPKGDLKDVLAYHNPEDPNEPKIRVVPAGKGKDIVKAEKARALQRKQQKAQGILLMVFLVLSLSFFLAIHPTEGGGWTVDSTTLFWGIIAAAAVFFVLRMGSQHEEKEMVPKLLITHEPNEDPPFIDATGAHAGALLGDVKHDPFQSGGLGTPAHERVDVGAIHKASGGVLYIDEINLLRMESQQSLLTALQEKKFPIIGQSERSSGAMVKTEPVPCDFVLVAAGNLDSIYGAVDERGNRVGGMHPALRSRIRGYGYEIYMKNSMPDTPENRKKLVRFVAQEVVKDGKIPHFTKRAVAEIINEAKHRSGRRGHLTLRLRELGGLVRVAGDVAKEMGAEYVDVEHVKRAKRIARSLEQQITDRALERKKEYKTFITSGAQIGMVNGLAVMGGGTEGLTEEAGLVLPIVAEVTPALSRSGGRIIATGKLGEIAKEAVENVSALLKKYTGQDISNYDIHIQFVGTYEGVEGDSASISIATAVISAFNGIPVDQEIGMTGSLSVRGQVLPVGGVNAKIEAAAQAGLKKVIIPAANEKDVLLDSKYAGKIEIIPVSDLKEVLSHALVGEKKQGLLDKLSNLVPLNIPAVPDTGKKPLPG
ncbi:MAG: ATP-dependent protease LonB [Thermoplasmata archaeon]|nr:ATP-dependent protease LonB [Thermoplasmata archaeon]